MAGQVSRPVFDAQRVNPEELRAAVAQHGCFVLNHLFDVVAISRIRERAEFVGHAWDYMVEHGYTSDIQDYVDGAFTAGHLPETHIDPSTTWSDLSTDSLFDDIATKVFGATTRGYALRRSTLRGQQNPLPFHQDAYFIGVEPWYNFWTPLEDCGIDAPGLEVIVGSGSPIIKTPTMESNFFAESSVGPYVDRTYGEKAYWAPEIKAGSVLVFTSLLFHRTQASPRFVKTRYSLELRGQITDPTLAMAGVPRDWSEIQTLPAVPG